MARDPIPPGEFEEAVDGTREARPVHCLLKKGPFRGVGGWGGNAHLVNIPKLVYSPLLVTRTRIEALLG